MATTPRARVPFDYGKIKGEGEGGTQGTALYDTEMIQILAPYTAFAGCVMRDEVALLLDTMRAEKRPRFGFVFNLSKSTEEGTHWVACYIDLLEDKEICFYNSFGDPCPPDIMKELKHFVDEWHLPYLVKFKSNRVVNQTDRSNRCGYHVAAFLETMFKGGSFKYATHFDEEDAKKDEKRFKTFGFI
jgi:Ulp1 protease family, C-terminal catalytic domain